MMLIIDPDAESVPRNAPPRRTSRARLLILGGVVVVLAALAVFAIWRMRKTEKPVGVMPEDTKKESSLSGLVFPTELDLLCQTNRETVFQPTASGRLTSAFWGSTRTGSDLKPRFHAGVDIAAARRDSAGRPLDPVLAVAAGTVVHVSKAPGGSSYGRYLVLRHDDPIGPVYSWYAHLGSIARSIERGRTVSAGEPLGVMGNSASYRIPRARGHLHLEFCLMLNRRFAEWARENGIRPDRGNFNGWNFHSVDPLDLYAARADGDAFNFSDYLRGVPSAFALLVDFERRPDYFSMYPDLWVGDSQKSGAMVLHVSEGGVILQGRGATGEERVRLSEAGVEVLVLGVDESVLGRNGLRIVEKHGSGWKPGSGLRRWLRIISY